eukprot:s1_g991.t1
MFVDLSSLSWRVSIEGREGLVAEARFEEALRALAEVYVDGEVAVFQVDMPVHAHHLETPYALFLGPIHTNSEVYLAGSIIGGAGHVSSRAWDFEGFAPGRKTQYFLLPKHIQSPGTYNLMLRAQSRVYLPGPVRGPRALMPFEEALAISSQNDFQLVVIEALWLSGCFVAFLFIVTRIGRHPDKSDRDRWFPLFLVFALLSLGPQTFILYEFGWVTPLLVRLGETYPLYVVLSLHMWATLGIKGATWQLSTLGILALSVVPLIWWEGSPAIAPLQANVFAASAFLVILFFVLGVIKARRERQRVSVWTYSANVWHVLLVALYIVPFYQFDLATDPLQIFMALWVFLFALAAADHGRWDREAVSRLSKDLLQSGEEERGRLARELHDGLSHHLALIRMRLERLSRGSTELQDSLREPIDELRASNEELAAMVEGLRPLSLSGGNLTTALQSFADRWNRLSDIQVTTDIDVLYFPDEETQLHILRIAQEAVQNAVRHGKAGNISIKIRGDDERLSIVVADNGSGFQSEQITDKGGVGVTAMKQRLELLNGALTIDSRLGEGTTVYAEVPLS